MDKIHILLMTKCDDAYCVGFQNALKPKLDRAFKTVSVDVLCAYNLTETLETIRRHRATIMVVALHYSCWENLATPDLPRLYSQIYNAVDLSTEIVLIEKNGHSTIDAIANRIKATRTSEQSDYGGDIISKLNQALATKSSDGKMQLNLQMVRFEEQLTNHIEAGQARMDIIQRQVENLEDQIALLDMKLFRYNPDTNESAPLIEQFRQLQRTVAATNSELSAAVKSLEVIRQATASTIHRTSELEKFEKRIDTSIATLQASGLQWLSKLGLAVGTFILALAVNAVGLGEWFVRLIAVLIGD